MSTVIAVAALRRLIEAEATVESQHSLIGALEAENRLLREEISQTPAARQVEAAAFLEMED